MPELSEPGASNLTLDPRPLFTVPEMAPIKEGDRMWFNGKLCVVEDVTNVNKAGGYFRLREATWRERWRARRAKAPAVAGADGLER